MTRRELLQLAASAPALAFAPRPAEGRRQRGLTLDAFQRAPWHATTVSGEAAPAAVQSGAHVGSRTLRSQLVQYRHGRRSH